MGHSQFRRTEIGCQKCLSKRMMLRWIILLDEESEKWGDGRTEEQRGICNCAFVCVWYCWMWGGWSSWMKKVKVAEQSSICVFVFLCFCIWCWRVSSSWMKKVKSGEMAEQRSRGGTDRGLRCHAGCEECPHLQYFLQFCISTFLYFYMYVFQYIS